jgi:hypothetical protein
VVKDLVSNGLFLVRSSPGQGCGWSRVDSLFHGLKVARLHFFLLDFAVVRLFVQERRVWNSPRRATILRVKWELSDGSFSSAS